MRQRDAGPIARVLFSSLRTLMRAAGVNTMQTARLNAFYILSIAFRRYKYIGMQYEKRAVYYREIGLWQLCAGTPAPFSVFARRWQRDAQRFAHLSRAPLSEKVRLPGFVVIADAPLYYRGGSLRQFAVRSHRHNGE